MKANQNRSFTTPPSADTCPRNQQNKKFPLPQKASLPCRMYNELTVTCVRETELPAPNAPNTVAHHLFYDRSGATSVRFESEKITAQNKYPAGSKTVFGDRSKYPDTYVRHDRDLGQTFRAANAEPQKLDAVYLRMGPNGADISACGARIAIQLFEVSGNPLCNDNNTPGFLGRFDRLQAPELDDFLTGEVYHPLAVAVGHLPQHLEPLGILKLTLSGHSSISLQPGQDYAFLVLLPDRKPGLQLTLANCYYGNYCPAPENQFVGHGIRREGTPKLPDHLEERLLLAPGTLGFPDVCTWRDYFFLVTGKPL